MHNQSLIIGVFLLFLVLNFVFNVDVILDMPIISFRNFEGIPSNGAVDGAVEDASLDTIFSDDDNDSIEDDSDSDGFLSEVWKWFNLSYIFLTN